MPRISFTTKGDFSKTEKFLNKMKTDWLMHKLEKYGEEGVKALSEATPKDTGKTAASWSYEISNKKGKYQISWNNSNCTGGEGKGIPIVVLLQYGHGTRQGGYVQGIDFINPAIRPIFDKIAQDAWLEVVNS